MFSLFGGKKTIIKNTENLYFEGAEGNETIKTLASSYRTNQLKTISGLSVVKSKMFINRLFLFWSYDWNLRYQLPFHYHPQSKQLCESLQ